MCPFINVITLRCFGGSLWCRDILSRHSARSRNCTHLLCKITCVLYIHIRMDVFPVLLCKVEKSPLNTLKTQISMKMLRRVNSSLSFVIFSTEIKERSMLTRVAFSFLFSTGMSQIMNLECLFTWCHRKKMIFTVIYIPLITFNLYSISMRTACFGIISAL